MSEGNSRRGFIGSLFVFAAGAAAASVLAGCVEEVTSEASVGAGPVETVALRPGMHHFATPPRRIASVRTFDLPRVVSHEAVSTKAM